MILQDEIWHARLAVPADVQAALGGRKVFAKTTGHRDRHAACATALPVLEGWRAEIRAARDPAMVPRLFHRMDEGSNLTDLERADTSLGDIPRVIFRAATIREDEYHRQLKLDGFNPAQALKHLVGPQATLSLRALSEAATPLSSRLTAWQAANRGQLVTRTLYQYSIDIEKITFAQDLTIERLCKKDIQQFIDSRTSSVSTATIKRQINALSSYWMWLCTQDANLKGRDIFSGLEFPRATRKRIDPTKSDFVLPEHESRARFTALQVSTIWKAAHDRGAYDLRDAIAIAAYTGARREGVMSLHVKTVILTAPTPYIQFDEKTEAGFRRVPIHPNLLTTLSRRASSAGSDGFLFRSGQNKIGSRGARLNNPLRVLLNNHGFGPGYGFHSFRRTFVDFMMCEGISEVHAAKIIGHAISTMTYGVYAGELTPEQSLKIITEVVKYPGGLIVEAC